MSSDAQISPCPMPRASGIMAGMRFLGVALLLACASDRERTEVVSPATLDSPRCSLQEREAAICAQLRGSVLLSAKREPLDLVLSECHVASLTAELRWSSRTGSPSYRAVLVFQRPTDPRGPLHPEALHPVLLEWPCTADCNIPASAAHLPVTEQCTSPRAHERQVEVAVPPIDGRSCVGAALISDGELDWCSRSPKAGDESYDIRGRRGYFASHEHIRIQTFANWSSAEIDGQPATAPQLKRLRAQLAMLWQLPSEVSESCRDGGLMTIKAQRADGWKVLLRSCSHPVDREALLPTPDALPSD